MYNNTQNECENRVDNKFEIGLCMKSRSRYKKYVNPHQARNGTDGWNGKGEARAASLRVGVLIKPSRRTRYICIHPLGDFVSWREFHEPRQGDSDQVLGRVPSVRDA